MSDVSPAMSLDLNTILKDWPHENGNIKVRKITGLDGREKLQLRVDLGVLQMEMSGRPGWSTSAQMRVAPGISSKAGGPRGGERPALRAYA